MGFSYMYEDNACWLTWQLQLKVGVCVQKSMHVTLSFAFSSRYAKTRTYNFRKVVRQVDCLLLRP